MSHGITADPDLESALTGTLSVSADLTADADSVDIRAEIARMPAALAGAKLRLRLGSTTLMTMQLPDKPVETPLRFGPARLVLAKLRRQRDFRLTVSGESGTQPKLAPVHRIAGDLLEALTIPTAEIFFAKIQMHHSRYKTPALLALGALSAYGRFEDFHVKAASLTVLAHRLLEQEFESFNDDDRQLMRWICVEGERLVGEGADHLAGSGDPSWCMLRWTVSLATVCGLLSIAQDRLGDARAFFAQVSAQTDQVRIAPVCALNLVNGCLIHGILLGAEGEFDLARDVLARGVNAYPKCVAAQNVMSNIWVIGDLINVARASRMCFIALGRMGLLQPTGLPQMEKTDVLDISQVQSPLHAILQAGLSPRLAATVKGFAARRLDPGIAI